MLLFKIELNTKIVPVFERNIGPIQFEPVDPFTHESNRETSTCECFAVLLLYCAIIAFYIELKNNMRNFGNFQGYPVM